jgi:hypothetical protein
MIMKIELGDVTIVCIGSDEEAIEQECSDCHKMEELRPYGKNAAMVCFECAMKDPINAKAMFERQMKGDA